MAADQLNFDYSQYESDDGNTYCLRANAADIASADLGGSACTDQKAYGRATRRRAPRHALWVDKSTFRTKRSIVFTKAAAAALVPNTTTVAVHVPGEAATVTYTLAGVTAERVPKTLLQSSKPDHA